MSKTLLVIVLGVIGLLFLGIAIYYWITPANQLLHFMPGYASDITKTHFKHGLGAVILAIGAWTLAWFQSAKRNTANPPATTQ